MQNVLLIINPVSGRKTARMKLYEIVDFMSRNDCKTTIFTTSRKGEATEIVKTHATEYDRIVCCGGDGTLNEVFTGITELGIQIPVGYVPTGTTNDLANALGLTSETPKALNTAIYGEKKSLDIGEFNDTQFFSYVASFGAFTKTSYATPQWMKNVMGHTSYLVYGIADIKDIRSHKTKIITDGLEISGEFVFGSVSNSTVLGGVFKFPEDSIDFSDGKFEVLLVKTPRTPRDMQSILNAILNQEYNEDTVLFFKASFLTFIFEESTPWTIDGEFAGTMEQVTIKNLHGRAEVFVDGEA